MAIIDHKFRLLLVLFAALIVGFAMSEMAGWPFLAKPLQSKISELVNREVVLIPHSSRVKNTKANPSANDFHSTQKFSINFLGAIELKTQQLVINNPSWSQNPHFLIAENIILKLRYIDLWRAYKGEPIIINSLKAQNLHVNAERLADGRASWRFSQKPKLKNAPIKFPVFDYLAINQSALKFVDATTESDISANLSTVTKQTEFNSANKSTVATKTQELNASATGTYKKLPLKITLTALGKLSENNQALNNTAVTLNLDAIVENARLKFSGSTPNLFRPSDFKGDFKLSGSSLSAVGDVLNVTLPTTAKFATNGHIDKKGLVWKADLKKIEIGESEFNARFTYDKSSKIPMLKGDLIGKLVIVDLGPAIGTSEKINKNKVLPIKPFDLAALEKMNADIDIDIEYLDLKTPLLEPLKPLQAKLMLKNGDLALNNIRANTAGGQLKGAINLNGSDNTANINTKLAWNNINLSRWVKQKRDDGLPPYISGQLSGSASLKGQGNSTATILANLDGSFKTEITRGAISHLAVEVTGLDLADSIGVMFKGDESLLLECAIVDLQVANGVFKPRMMVLDTKDSTVLMNGSLSLATETLDLKAMSLPKDFSPLTIRTPLNINGSFANPQVTLDKKPIGLKLATSALLAIINPLAAVVPFVDLGNKQEALRHSSDCKKMMGVYQK